MKLQPLDFNKKIGTSWIKLPDGRIFVLRPAIKQIAYKFDDAGKPMMKNGLQEIHFDIGVIMELVSPEDFEKHFESGTKIYSQGLICADCGNWGSHLITSQPIDFDVAFISYCGECKTNRPFVANKTDKHGRKLAKDEIKSGTGAVTVLEFVASYDPRFQKYKPS